MKRTSKGSTIKQYAYATRRLSGTAKSKKEAALLSGYSLTMAENVKAKVEDTDGYQNALVVLGAESNNLLLSIMAEFKVRGLSEFSNKDLVSAMNAFTSAWAKIDERRAPNKLKTPEGNPLRSVFTERVTRTRTVAVGEAPANAEVPETQDAEFVETTGTDLDF